MRAARPAASMASMVLLATAFFAHRARRRGTLGLAGRRRGEGPARRQASTPFEGGVDNAIWRPGGGGRSSSRCETRRSRSRSWSRPTPRELDAVTVDLAEARRPRRTTRSSSRGPAAARECGRWVGRHRAVRGAVRGGAPRLGGQQEGRVAGLGGWFGTARGRVGGPRARRAPPDRPHAGRRGARTPMRVAPRRERHRVDRPRGCRGAQAVGMYRGEVVVKRRTDLVLARRRWSSTSSTPRCRIERWRPALAYDREALESRVGAARGAASSGRCSTAHRMARR